jgi:hypothetical protein
MATPDFGHDLFAQATKAFGVMTADEQIGVLAHFAAEMHAALYGGKSPGHDVNLQMAFVNAVHAVITKG